MTLRRVAMAALLIALVFECVPSSAGAPPTVGELLDKRGIELKKGALVAALENDDSEVRSLAAVKLADDKESDTIPAIVHALQVEKVATAKTSMALALAQLGEPIGFSTLQENCVNSISDSQVRVQSAEYLLVERKSQSKPTLPGCGCSC